jgi:hypothetical protein
VYISFPQPVCPFQLHCGRVRSQQTLTFIAATDLLFLFLLPSHSTHCLFQLQHCHLTTFSLNIMPPKKDTAGAEANELLAGFTDKETKLLAAAYLSSTGPDKVNALEPIPGALLSSMLTTYSSTTTSWPPSPRTLLVRSRRCVSNIHACPRSNTLIPYAQFRATSQEKSHGKLPFLCQVPWSTY